MLKYRVETDRNMVVDYLGVFEEGEPQELTEADAAWFERSRGVPLLQDNLPEGVELTIVVVEEKEEAE
jgi:hypothetical protein